MRAVIATTIVVLTGLATPAVAGATTEPPASEATDLSTLVDRWVGAPRTVGALGTGTSAAFVEIDGETLVFQTGIEDNPSAFHSSISATGPDTFELALSSDVLTCTGGAVGSYRFALSSESTTLSIIPLGDECAERALAISGNWWHTACWLEDRDCLGPVEPGTYATNRFNPFGDFTFGEVSFTLPQGWAVCYDSHSHLRLQPVPECSDEVGFGIWLWADVAAPLQDCSFLPDPDAALGAANIADYLEALPTLADRARRHRGRGAPCGTARPRRPRRRFGSLRRMLRRHHDLAGQRDRPRRLRSVQHPTHAADPGRCAPGTDRRDLPRGRRSGPLRRARCGGDAGDRVARVLGHAADDRVLTLRSPRFAAFSPGGRRRNHDAGRWRGVEAFASIRYRVRRPGCALVVTATTAGRRLAGIEGPSCRVRFVYRRRGRPCPPRHVRNPAVRRGEAGRLPEHIAQPQRAFTEPVAHIVTSPPPRSDTKPSAVRNPAHDRCTPSKSAATAAQSGTSCRTSTRAACWPSTASSPASCPRSWFRPGSSHRCTRTTGRRVVVTRRTQSAGRWISHTRTSSSIGRCQRVAGSGSSSHDEIRCRCTSGGGAETVHMPPNVNWPARRRGRIGETVAG